MKIRAWFRKGRHRRPRGSVELPVIRIAPKTDRSAETGSMPAAADDEETADV